MTTMMKIMRPAALMFAAALALGVSRPALADHASVGIDIGGRRGTGIDLRLGFNIRDHDRVYVAPPCVGPVYEDRPVQVWVPPMYRTTIEHVWVAPGYRMVSQQVWVPPSMTPVTQSVWVADRWEQREMTTYEGNRQIVSRQWVLVQPGHYETRTVQTGMPGHYETVQQQVAVGEGHWEDVQRQEVVCPAHYETRIQRVVVAPARVYTDTSIRFGIGYRH